MKLSHRNKLLFILMVCSSLLSISQNSLQKSVVSSGGRALSNVNYKMNITIGQPIVAKWNTLGNTACVGFWYRLENLSNKKLIVEKYNYPEPVIRNKIIPILNLNVYPNPFAGKAYIEFELNEKSMIRLSMIDQHGREADLIMGQNMDKGKYKIDYSALTVMSGMYTLILKTEKYFLQKRCLILR